MKLPRRNFLHLAAGAAALPAVSRIARAQAYPSRPITIVAPFPAGGATDIVSRTLAEGMKAPLGQTILVENVTGASGTERTGAARAAGSEADRPRAVIRRIGADRLGQRPFRLRAHRARRQQYRLLSGAALGGHAAPGHRLC